MSKSGKRSLKGKVGKTVHFVSTMLVGIVLCANIAVILVLLTCGLGTFVSPTTSPRIGLFCLFYPLFAAANLAFIPVWLLIRWRMVIVPVIGMLLSAAFTQSYCPVHFTSNDAPADGAKVLRMMTFNSHFFKDMDKDGADSTYTFLNYLRRDTFDIIALQESELSGRKEAVMTPFMESLGYTCVKPSDSKYKSNLLYTRLKVIDAAPMPMPTTSTNIAAIYRLLFEGDTITVVNAHLESYHLEDPAKAQYRDALRQFNPDTTRNTGLFMINLMKPKMKYHGEQIDSLLEFIGPLVEQDKMVILCGDFNDSPVSYACRRARTVLTDAYREAGWGTGFTYHEKAMPFRIDHIFTSRRLKPLKTWVENSVLESDHYPLASILEVLPKKAGGES